MSFFDIFNLDPKEIVDFFERFGVTLSLSVVEVCINILALVLLLLLLIGMVQGFVNYGDYILTWLCKNRRWRKSYIKKGLEHSFGDYLLPEKQSCYIPTQSQGIPPHNYDEPDEAVSATPQQELVQFFLKNVFTVWNTNRQLYCILAGSGMGKTTFAVRLFIEYINKYQEKNLPYHIFIKDLGEPKVIDEINLLASQLGEDAHQSILILDALDENLQASEDFYSFKDSLENAISPFKFVVVTCRSQFFPNEQAIPQQSHIRKNTPEKNLLNYNKVYICPFSPDDIKLYIRKKYPGWRKKKRRLRKQANAIIDKCKHLMVRPVLLSYIDDLLGDEKSYTTETEIYESLIRKWLNREVNAIPDATERSSRYDELESFSIQLSIAMYQNWRETGDFRLDPDQMDDFCHKNGFDSSRYQFRRRSLINHDAVGAYKFSHKSFLEYFLAKYYFENPDFDFSFEGMDMAELFYQGFCKREFKELKAKKICTIELFGDGKFFLAEETRLIIARRSETDYTHMSYVIAPNVFTELVLNWSAYNSQVQNFIEKSSIQSITICNYQKGSGSIKQILKAHGLKSVAVDGPDLPTSFIKEAQKMGVHVFANDETVVRGSFPMSEAPISLQLRLQREQLMHEYRRNKLKMSNYYIDEMQSDSKNEGGLEK